MDKKIKNRMLAVLIYTFVFITAVFVVMGASVRTAKAEESAQAGGIYGQEDFYFVSGIRLSTMDLGTVIYRIMVTPEVFETDSSAVVLFSSDESDLISGIDIELTIESDWENIMRSDGSEWMYYDVEITVNNYRKVFSITAYLGYSYEGNEYTVSAKSLSRSYVQALRILEQNGGDEALMENFGEEESYTFVKNLLNADSSGFASKVESGRFFNVVLGREESDLFGEFIFAFDGLVPNIDFYFGSDYVRFIFIGDGRLLVENNASQLIEEVSYDYYAIGIAGGTFRSFIRFNFLKNDDITLTNCTLYRTEPRVVMFGDSEEGNNEGLLAEIEEWRSKYEEVSASLTQKDNALNSANSQINQLIKDNQALENRIENLITQHAEEIENLTISANNDKAELNNTIAEKEKRIAELQAEKTRLEGIISEKNAEIENLTVQISTLNSNNAKLAADLEAAQKERDDYKSQYEAVNDALAGDGAAFGAIIDNYRAQIAEKDKKIKQLTEENENLKKELDTLQDKQGVFSVGCTGGGSGGIGAGVGNAMFTSGSALFTGLLFMVWRKYGKRKKTAE